MGERLALQALKNTYGRNIVSEGPSVRSAVLGGQANTAVLSFDNADGLACTRGFEIAGSDGLFYPATFQIEGDKIILSSSSVKNPCTVRYGWQGFTDADLHNAAGLPASTFQVHLSQGFSNVQ